MADRLLDRLLQPRIVFGTLAVVIVLASLFAPEGEPDDAAGTLSTLSYEPGGMRGWYEGAGRLGWKVKRLEERFHGSLDENAVYVVLSPEIEPTASEVGVLLGAVRRGAGLIVSAERGSPLADSLHLYSDDFQYVGHPVVGGRMPGVRGVSGARGQALGTADTARGVTDSVSGGGADSVRLSGIDRARLQRIADSVARADSVADEDDEDVDFGPVLGDSAVVKSGDADSAARRVTRRAPVAADIAAYTHHVHLALTSLRPYPADTSAFVSVMTMHRLQPTIRPAVLGMPVGEGRIVVVADAGILRNSLLSQHDLVILPQRLLEWTAPSVASPVIFDEYHHGLGNHGSALRAIRGALFSTPVGRAGVQLLFAGLVLLLALGARPIAARARMRLERRSPLEHVGALSRAYMQKGATRLAARRLVRGIRRRHGAAARSSDDEAYLRRLAERHPALAPSVERLVKATKNPVSPRELTELADDIDMIERTLST
ncbi:MAG TPA: hypothetical protein VFN39_07485 [Gemmatimonadaceae bacterium]|nr:hypothetical protein [Gemmatimonadaceae bacterium]